MILALLAPPTVTLSEVEIGLPQLVAKYAEAIGEPVVVLPSVERRAVAVFAKNEPWERVITLAGKATGFRIARKDGKLRAEATQFPNLESLQREANQRLRAFALPPADAVTAYPSHDRPISASSPHRLVLARYLKRGGVLPLGKTVLVPFADYVAPREFAVFNRTGESRPVPERVAFRLDDGEVTVALDPASLAGIPFENPISLPLIPASKESAEARASALQEVKWTSVAAPPIGRFWGYRIGDVLGWMHRASGKLCVGAAPRVGLPRGLNENLVDALLNGPVRASAEEDAFLITTAYGDGFWPRDLDPMENEKSPTLAGLAAFSTGVSPLWDALLGREYGFVASQHSVAFNALPLLRMLGRATPEGMVRFRRGEPVALGSLDVGTADALWRLLIEDASPAKAILRSARLQPVVTLDFSEEDAVILSTEAGQTGPFATRHLTTYPDILRGFPAEFIYRQTGVIEGVWMTVADFEDQPDAFGTSVIRVTGAKRPRER